ncbi:hypothetical protein B0H19DRAFT_1258753 [Mycena capillaripes]|nr:hypothetical protein B0H19DRAFT_1258753 [Mycena capillaripes]
MLDAVANVSLSMPAAPTRGDAAIDLDLATASPPSSPSVRRTSPSRYASPPSRRHDPLVRPFVMEYATRGGIAGIQTRRWLLIGSFRRTPAQTRSCTGAQIGFLAGWVHHVVYIGIVEIAADRAAFHFFLPTFLPGASTLLPLLRSNTLFALTVLAKSIHRATLLLDVPALACPLPFSVPLQLPVSGCVAGFIGRCRQGKAETVQTSDVDGGTHPHPLTPNVCPDAGSYPAASIPPVSLIPYAWAGMGVGVAASRLLRDRLVCSSHLLHGAEGERRLRGRRAGSPARRGRGAPLLNASGTGDD